HRARLVVDDGKPSVMATFYTIGRRGDGEGTGRAGEMKPAFDLREQGSKRAAPAALAVNEPARDSLEPRPPESTHGRPANLRTEFLTPDRQQSVERIGGQGLWEFFDEALERAMNPNAAVGRARFRIDGLERPQPQDMLCVDGIGIAPPQLHVRHAHAA